jgi:hypothetical protein
LSNVSIFLINQKESIVSVHGLGVRNLRLMNISLLTKWRWRLIGCDEALWKNVLRSKYGEVVTITVYLEAVTTPWYASSSGTNLNLNWFAQQVVRKIGNGEDTSFWSDKWVGEMPLKEKFL